MAEAWANHLGQGRVRATSAGTHAFGSIPDHTIIAMDEKGIYLDEHWSKGVSEVDLADADVLVRMGREVEFSVPADFKGRVVDWNIPDPFARGLETFRKTRDLIEGKVVRLLADLPPADSAP